MVVNQSTLNVNLTQTTTNTTGSVTIKGNTLNCVYGTVPVTFPVYGIVDGDSLVLGSVIQGSTAVTFDGAILGGGNVLSGSFFDPSLPDFGTWSLQR